ncbi:MAG: hypothetical protein M3Z05_05450 [Gemmatimonadota bacterium]|nr:hypothetical protein [Gemmatimonadota bacterium]
MKPAAFLCAALFLAQAARAQEFAPSAVTLASVAAVDTTPVHKRPRAIEISDAYALRLRIHRYAAYSVIPLFVVQAVAGNQLFQADRSGAVRPGWASSVHSVGAAAIGGVFTLETVTGLWNLWESRDNEVGRTRRLVHSALLLASDAGFTYAGIKLASDARNDSRARDNHKKISYYSMGAALAGYGIMLVGNP